MIGDRTLTMVKSPSHFGANFRFVVDHLRCLASNQTLLLFMKGVNPQLLHEDITCQVSLCAPRASSHVATKDLRWASTAGMEELEIKEWRT